jgi:magnesium chelatase family protein
LNRISGPFLDRIDLQVNVPKIDLSKALKIKHQRNSVLEVSQKITGPNIHLIKLAANSQLNSSVDRHDVNLRRASTHANSPHSEQSSNKQRSPTAAQLVNNEIETSEIVKRRVIAAQQRQLERQGKLNKSLSGKEIEQYCPLSETESLFLSKAMQSMNLSMRAYHRTMRVARTIADLDCVERVNQQHLAEALSFRGFDRMLNELTE